MKQLELQASTEESEEAKTWHEACVKREAKRFTI
jgi:hypothetical protein